MNDSAFVRLKHNFQPGKFKWLWMKYVTAINDQKHCTNCLRGKYGKVLSKHNHDLETTPILTLNEQPTDTYEAIYICGVIKKGYPNSNYIHNLHTVIKHKPGAADEFRFEEWQLSVENGVFEEIPSEEEIPAQYRGLPPRFKTCRIFRWAVCSGLQVVH